MNKIIIFLALVFLSFKANDSDKKLSVTLSVNDWQSDIDILEIAKNALKQSDLPAKNVLPLVDSITKIQNEFIGQLKPQIDTTKKK